MRRSNGGPEAHDNLIDKSRSIIPAQPVPRFALSVIAGGLAEPAEDPAGRALRLATQREDDPDRVKRENDAYAALHDFELACSRHGETTYTTHALMALKLAIERFGTGWLTPGLADKIPGCLEMADALGNRRYHQITGRLWRDTNPSYQDAYAKLEREYADARRF